MRRDLFSSLIIASMLLSVTGCQTVKGSAEGVKQDVQVACSFPQAVVHGVRTADNWLHENFW